MEKSIEEMINSADLLVVMNQLVFLYAVGICICYLLLSFLASRNMSRYKKKNSFVDYKLLLASDYAPSISLIAPAYNEAMTIVENVRSLLSLHYNNCEIIIVNDGSADQTLQLLIEAYDLHPVKMAQNSDLLTKQVRSVYQSANPAYRKLRIIDKENGGKADALNVGINYSSNALITCIDVDCILEPDALLRLVKPFLESEKKVIAAGGVIRIANACKVQEGRLVKVNLPDKFLARVQVLEYFRAFLMGRMGWDYLDGLLLISGAFGMFDKATVIKAGGYDTGTVGEDMELLVRMRKMMYEQKEACKVAFIPDPLCWTEAPQSMDILLRQRNRWTRGTAETLLKHRKMILNRKYGLHGLLSLPFWVLLEWFAPLAEFIGLLLFSVMAVLGYIDWVETLSLLLFIYCFALTQSVFAILFEERSYQQYKRPKQMLGLVITALLEPVFYHPLMVWAAVKGNYDLITGKKSWGKMARTGFSKN